jgi:hypothetical protein
MPEGMATMIHGPVTVTPSILWCGHLNKHWPMPGDLTSH